MARKGLGKGLDSLIPEIYDDNFDSNSPQSLEDILNGNDEEESSGEEKKNIFDEIQEEINQEKESHEEVVKEASEDVKDIESEEVNQESEDLHSMDDSQESVQTSQEIEVQRQHVAEVKEIVDKNPRITLWSSRSSAVFRYLRKTEPEFSISKEASILIDEAVSKKYPEIWALFDDY